jgi:hypothetical protein
VVQHRPERRPVARRIQQEHRLGVQPELAPCQDLEELVERSRAPRQHHDRVGVHEHDLLAFVHRLGDDEGREVALADLEVHQVAGDHAECLAASGLRRARHGAHQPHVARTVDKALARLRQGGPEGGGVGHESGVDPGPGAAIDTDRRAWHGVPCA